MGACCSKTDTTVTSTPIQPELQPEKKKNTAVAIIASNTEPETLKKDVFVVKNRKSHELDRHPDQEICKLFDRKKTPNLCPNSDISKLAGDLGKVVSMGEMVRTSSCTKEEVDAILIQCGRLSRSSSGVNPAGGETPTRGRRYSGSKRSFDFDDDDDDVAVAVAVSGDSGRRQREPRVSSPSSSRRRSRERDPQQQRSGSKERGSGSGSGGRRVSRSPNRRSESPVPNSTGTVAAGGGGGGGNRPGKMVSVPATDKTNNAGGGEVVGAGVSGGVKKIQVKRTTGEAAVARPATVRVLNENQNPQPLTLSRSNSPHRRNPLGEIDTNVVGSEQPGSKKPNSEKTMNNKTDQNVSRTRSSRLSRDLDINLESLINANPNPKPNPNPPSYASLLLEDIQNFHQKNPSACVNKACTSSNDRQLMLNDDMMEPSLHKYVTVRRGGGDADTEEQESSGSNSFAGSQQLSWMSSSWDPNSGDSTDCWTSKSRSDVEFEKSGEYPRNGIGRGRVGAHGRSAYSLPNNTTFGSV